MSLTFCKKFCLSLLCILCCLVAICQKPDSTVHAKPADTSQLASDTIQPEFIIKLQEKGKEITHRNIEKYKAGKLAIKQQYLLDEIKSTAERAKIYLKKGIDTSNISSELKQTGIYLNIVKQGVFLNTGTIQTQRNLAASSAVLTELLNTIKDQKAELSEYNKDLIDFRNKIDSLSSDPALYTTPPDSLGALQYIQKVQIVAKEIGPTDSAVNQTVSYSRDLETQVDLMLYSLRSSLEDVERYRRVLTSKALSRELPNIGGPVANARPLTEIIQFSIAKEKLALDFYFKENKTRIGTLFLLIFVCYFFIRKIKRKMAEEKMLDLKYQGQMHSVTLSYLLLFLLLAFFNSSFSTHLIFLVFSSGYSAPSVFPLFSKILLLNIGCDFG
jgi:hypothetical protein